MVRKWNPETWEGDRWAGMDKAENFELKTPLLVVEILPACSVGPRPFLHKSVPAPAPGIVAACAHVASPQHSPTNIARCLQPTERVLSQNSPDTEVKV